MKIGYQDNSGVIYQGNCLDTLKGLPDASIHMCVTSPPYWGLRNYGHDEQLGMESTPEAYVAGMVTVFREVRRVLHDTGTLWINIGDSYASTPTKGQSTKPSKMTGGRANQLAGMDRPNKVVGDLKQKDLVGIPWMLAFALRADGWYLRSDILWSKKNCMPESVTDRPTKSHEYIFLLAKKPTYFYDAEAVKEPNTSGPSDIKKMVEQKERYGGKHKDLVDPLSKASSATNIGNKRDVGSPDGRNRRSVWEISTTQFSGAHFATYPPALILPCVLAGTSAHGVCEACGTPWYRVVEKTNVVDESAKGSRFDRGKTADRDGGSRTQAGERYKNVAKGWAPGCECGAGVVPATVLDPFMGSGTTALVAKENGRRYIGCELNPEYIQIAANRLKQQVLF